MQKGNGGGKGELKWCQCSLLCMSCYANDLVKKVVLLDPCACLGCELFMCSKSCGLVLKLAQSGFFVFVFYLYFLKQIQSFMISVVFKC